MLASRRRRSDSARLVRSLSGDHVYLGLDGGKGLLRRPGVDERLVRSPWPAARSHAPPTSVTTTPLPAPRELHEGADRTDDHRPPPRGRAPRGGAAAVYMGADRDTYPRSRISKRVGLAGPRPKQAPGEQVVDVAPLRTVDADRARLVLPAWGRSRCGCDRGRAHCGRNAPCQRNSVTSASNRDASRVPTSSWSPVAYEEVTSGGLRHTRALLDLQTRS